MQHVRYKSHFRLQYNKPIAELVIFANIALYIVICHWLVGKCLLPVFTILSDIFAVYVGQLNVIITSILVQEEVNKTSFVVKEP